MSDSIELVSFVLSCVRQVNRYFILRCYAGHGEKNLVFVKLLPKYKPLQGENAVTGLNIWMTTINV